MKKRIGWLHNKPIIQGDKNLKNSNELHIDELSSSNSQGGGSDLSNIPFYYYKIIKTPGNEIEFNALFTGVGYFEYVVNAKGHGIFQTNATNAYEDYTNIIAIKLIDIPIVIKASTNDEIYTVNVSGDLYNRLVTVYSKISESMAEQAALALNTYTSQITKEEYEAMITIRPTE